jgi:hypothetical protein
MKFYAVTDAVGETRPEAGRVCVVKFKERKGSEFWQFCTYEFGLWRDLNQNIVRIPDEWAYLPADRFGGPF